MPSDMVTRFNDPKRGKYTHKNAQYQWTDKEVREAADVMARGEVYDRHGERNTSAEKRLLTFASDAREYHQIASIIQQARASAIERAKLDENWDREEEPFIEDDSELRTRKRRRRLIPVGLLGFAGVVAIGIAATGGFGQTTNDFAFSVETIGRNSTVEEISFTSRTGEETTLVSENYDIPRRGEVATFFEIGVNDDDVYEVTVTGQGTLSCSIHDMEKDYELSAQTGEDSVTCAVDLHTT